MTRSWRILIADDHPIFRAGVRQLLSDAGIRTVGEAATAPQLLELARAAHWDAIILDLSLPGRGGLDLLKDLKAESPRRPVLILSMHPEDQFAVRALRSGASGYLTKETAAAQLITALERVVGGGSFVSEAVADQLVAAVGTTADRPPHEALSNREFEVLRLIASGKTVGEIASLLALSVKTVSGYRARILQKTGFRNNAELMSYAIRNSLVDPRHDEP